MSAGQDLQRLEEISRELAQFGREYAQATHKAVQARRNFKKAEAAALLVAHGKSAAERQAAAVEQLVQEGWFDADAVADATRSAMEARFRVLQLEVSALQTKLRVERVELGAG